jgi:hypothetical protein
LRQHPDLRPGQVHAAPTYCDDHDDRPVERMRASAEAAETERLKQPLSRAQLWERQSQGDA